MPKLFLILYLLHCPFLDAVILCVQPGMASSLGSGLLSPRALNQSALRLGNHSSSPERTQWIFPSIEFTCATTITSLSYASPSIAETGVRNKHPGVQTWRKSHSSSTLLYNQVERFNVTPDTVDGIVYTFSDLQIRIEMGDILGAYQPEGMESASFVSFQGSPGTLSYYHDGLMNPESSFDGPTSAEEGKLPLISVEASGV